MPELHFSRLLGALSSLPDSWSAQPVTLTQHLYNGSTYSDVVVFAGDVVGYVDRYMEGLGWVREYRAMGLLQRANYIPITDSYSLTDTSTWNLPGDDPMFIGSRAGQTVGQIVSAILLMSENAAPLQAAGFNISGTGPYTLPSDTVSDLAGMTFIPPWRVVISGERGLQSLEAFVQTGHPNHFLHVMPDGTIRFFDIRTFTPSTFTIGGDPRILPPELTRDYSDNYSQVEIRGNTLCVPVTLQTLPWQGSGDTDGGLQEDFAWGALDNAGAKAAWTPSNYSQPNQWGAAQDAGTCTCPDTTHVTVTSSNTSLTWASNSWGQGAGEALGYVILYQDAVGTSINQFFTARVVSNTALTAGGTSTLTLDTALPVTTYTSYQLFGLGAGPNIVGRRYKVTNTAIAAALQLRFPYPVAYLYAGGSAAEMVTAPMGTVMFGGSGTPPNYSAVSDGITIDPDNGLIYFDKPTQVVVGGLNTPVTWADNVQAFVPVAIGTLNAWAPSSSTHGGTLYTVEGIQRTKIITVPDWRDHSNDTNMATFATEMYDAMKDVVVEGSLPYLALLQEKYYTPGQSVDIAGADGLSAYTTGWESLALPLVGLDVIFQPGPTGTSYTTVMHLSNRRGRFSSSNFLRPNITGAQFGSSEGTMRAGVGFMGDVVSVPEGQSMDMPSVSSMVNPPKLKDLAAQDRAAIQRQDQALAAATAVPSHQDIIGQEQQQAAAQQQAINRAAGYEGKVDAGTQPGTARLAAPEMKTRKDLEENPSD